MAQRQVERDQKLRALVGQGQEQLTADSVRLIQRVGRGYIGRTKASVAARRRAQIQALSVGMTQMQGNERTNERYSRCYKPPVSTCILSLSTLSIHELTTHPSCPIPHYVLLTHTHPLITTLSLHPSHRARCDQPQEVQRKEATVPTEPTERLLGHQVAKRLSWLCGEKVRAKAPSVCECPQCAEVLQR